MKLAIHLNLGLIEVIIPNFVFNRFGYQHIGVGFFFFPILYFILVCIILIWGYNNSLIFITTRIYRFIHNHSCEK